MVCVAAIRQVLPHSVTRLDVRPCRVHGRKAGPGPVVAIRRMLATTVAKSIITRMNVSRLARLSLLAMTVS